MKYYELTYLISPELSENELKETQEKIISLIKKGGGEIEKSNKPIKVKLKYPIKKQGEGFLGTLSFYCPPEKLKNLEEKLTKEGFILRYLILRKKLFKKLKVAEIKTEKKMIKPKKEKKIKLEEIDKKLEEILGKI